MSAETTGGVVPRPLNPFDPSRPIDPTKFVGREKEIQELETVLQHVKRDRPRHFLITGERGVGKTSFFDYLREKATTGFNEGEFSFAVVDFAIDKRTTKLDFARAVKDQLDSILSAHPTYREALAKAWGFLQKFEAAGFAYRGDQGNSDLGNDLGKEIADSLREIVKRICSPSDEPSHQYDGVLILIDEVDQASSELDLGCFLKLLLEHLNRNKCHKVVFGLAGLTDSRQVLLNSHPSSLRIFDELALGNLNRTEVHQLLDDIQTIARDEGVGEFLIDQAARELLFELSGGHPHMLHQFGYCAFEAACNASSGEEFVVTPSHVTSGAFDRRGALDLIGDMYFREAFEDVEQHHSVFPVVDLLSSQSGALETINSIANQATLSEQSVQEAIDILVKSGLVTEEPGDRFGIRHPSFSYWLKAVRPQQAIY